MLNVNKQVSVTDETKGEGIGGRLRAIANTLVANGYGRVHEVLTRRSESDPQLCAIRAGLADDAKRWSSCDESVEGLLRAQELPMTAFGLRKWGEIFVSGSWKPLSGGVTRSLIFTEKGFEIMVVDADTQGDTRDWSFRRLANDKVTVNDLRRLEIQAETAIEHVKRVYEAVFRVDEVAVADGASESWSLANETSSVVQDGSRQESEGEV